MANKNGKQAKITKLSNEFDYYLTEIEQESILEIPDAERLAKLVERMKQTRKKIEVSSQW